MAYSIDNLGRRDLDLIVVALDTYPDARLNQGQIDRIKVRVMHAFNQEKVADFMQFVERMSPDQVAVVKRGLRTHETPEQAAFNTLMLQAINQMENPSE